MEIFINLIITAILYLPLPLIIRYGFKKKFNTMWAMIIAFLCFIVVKIVLMIITNEPFSNTAYLYLIISYFILQDSTMTPEQKRTI